MGLFCKACMLEEEDMPLSVALGCAAADSTGEGTLAPAPAFGTALPAPDEGAHRASQRRSGRVRPRQHAGVLGRGGDMRHCPDEAGRALREDRRSVQLPGYKAPEGPEGDERGLP
eukprot:CAMPEP_0177289656 /NCGR_PEP_ID=MMETSP0367-20130122/75334_1 /TAXON_ID=447022 ORGANISM="Scrippsiella hangoei-like, Strain SHHI-4" /NCGR_SAMPLE_ID=MMETSP0367 /ASSEMBLY_ACC=CAM_ASM_000362 /LENGTH=114 /DNA_ID=CAMNT_0018747107 /DNA_START=1 /DNA_END=347 /DNA_ORIENTATION=-